jgi:excisionase family DNA binding protein
MMVQKPSSIGEYVTLDAASKAKGVTYPTLYKWIKRNDIARVKIGTTLLVRLADLSGYQPRY